MRRAQHIPLTERKWQALKRRQLRDIERAIDDFNVGSLYTPAYSELLKVRDLVKQMRTAMRAAIQAQAGDAKTGGA